MSDPYRVEASDLASEAVPQLTFDVAVHLDWRFRLGLVLIKCGLHLMGFPSMEVRYIPTADADGHRPEVDPE
jgi:hypothetical protein